MKGAIFSSNGKNVDEEIPHGQACGLILQGLILVLVDFEDGTSLEQYLEYAI